MGTEIDKITVTFYGEKECKDIATPFREKAMKKYKSLNDALKQIINEWNSKN